MGDPSSLARAGGNDVVPSALSEGGEGRGDEGKKGSADGEPGYVS